MNLAVLNALPSAATHAAGPDFDASRLTGLVLVRLAGAAEALGAPELARDLQPVISHKLAPNDWREGVARMLAALAAAGFAQKDGSKWRATGGGRRAAAEFLGLKRPAATRWEELRDIALVAKALGLETESPARLKALGKLEGLRAYVVLDAFRLKLRGKPSASRLRAALALVALERAFGNQIKGGLGEKPGLSAKSGRLLAGQLAKRPRDFGTDGRLIAALAAEAVDAPRSDLGTLRLALLRRFVTKPGQTSTSPRTRKASKSKKALGERGRTHLEQIPAGTAPARIPAPVAAPQQLPPVRPDPQGFAQAALAAARPNAEGWPGNRKAYISRVWETVRDRHPEWALSEIEFKCMLTEAHRSGLIALANADLKDKSRLRELQDSAISYKNTVWHFIRVDD